MGDVVDFPSKKEEEIAFAESESGWFPVFLCHCDNPFFYVTPEGMKCADPECGEYLDLNDYEET